MTRAHFVKKARKDHPEGDIKKGDRWEKNRRVLRRKLTVIGVSTWQRSKRGYWSRQASGGSTFAGPSGPSGKRHRKAERRETRKELRDVR